MFLVNILKNIKDKIFIQILITILVCIFSYSYLSKEIVSFFYSISLLLRAILNVVLPFFIITALSTAFSTIKRKVLFFGVFVLFVIALSNFINLMISFSIGKLLFSSAYHSNASLVHELVTKIEPSFFIQIPLLINNKYAIIIGLIIGLSCSLFSLNKIEKIMNDFHQLTAFFVFKIVTKLLPIFIAGFLLKLLVEGQLKIMLANHLGHSLKIIMILCIYIFIWFLIASWFNLKKLKEIFTNIFPAILTGFTTMSNGAALPLSIEGSVKNTNDPMLVRSFTPLSTNLHMLGDVICMPLIALIVISIFGASMPSFFECAKFGVYFIFNKFASPVLPGGTIMVSLPVLKNTLNFTDEMTGIMTALYLVFEPIATAANIAGNGIFIIYLKKILNFFKL